MTGFARLRRTAAEGELVLSVKALNHRGLDIHFYLPAELDPYEPALRVAVKRHLNRGHVEIRAGFVRPAGAAAGGLNTALMETYLAAFRAAAGRFSLAGEPDINVALRMPGMLQQMADLEPNAGMEMFLVAAVEDAMAELNRFREREGAEIAALLRQRNSAIRDAAAEIEQLRAQALPAFQARLQQRLTDLLAGCQVEPHRIVQEAAILADRSDIGEELDRLRIHTIEFDSILDAGGELGKKLDFLSQELNREANTMLSKTNGIGDLGMSITAKALAIKADIEKIREQTLNLE